MAVLRAIVDQEQDRGGGQGGHQVVEQGLRFRVDPVEVLQHEDEGLDLALPQEHTLHGVEREMTALGRLEVPQAVFLGQGVEQPEDRSDDILERFVQGEQMSGDLGADRANVVTVVEAEMGLEEIDHRKIAGGPAIGEGARVEDPASGNLARKRAATCRLQARP